MAKAYIVHKTTGGILGVFSEKKFAEDAIAVTFKFEKDAPLVTLADHLKCGFYLEVWEMDDYSKLHSGGACESTQPLVADAYNPQPFVDAPESKQPESKQPQPE